MRGRANLQAPMESFSIKPKNRIIGFFLRLILAGMFLAYLLYVFGPSYIRLFLPLFSYTIEIIHPDYEIKELYLDVNNQIMYQVRVYRVGFDDLGRALGGSEVKAGIVARALYISPLILYSLLLAWPGLSIRERLKTFLISIPLLIASQLIDIPFDIISRIEKPWGVHSPVEKFREFWNYLLNNGGRQFLAVIVFLISMASVRLIRPSRVKTPVGRNDPCPCGSGKKFKKCCGK